MSTLPPSLEQARIVPLATIRRADRLGAVVAGLIEGGLPIAEITLRTDEALAAISIAAAIPGFVVGAGTILEVGQVDRAVDAGASFLVSPGLDEAVIERALTIGVPIIPGVATATEVMRARSLGLQTVKLFPVRELGGPAVVAALAAPFPRLRFLVSGGIVEADVPRYLSHPSVLSVGGSWMLTPHDVEAGNTAAIAEATRRAVAMARR
jgi:2-dehydro-3-deoxyphosphogluconate aldolase/(4S)-4-hydroxy-2-oxoglutarate aldolase